MLFHRLPPIPFPSDRYLFIIRWEGEIDTTKGVDFKACSIPSSASWLPLSAQQPGRAVYTGPRSAFPALDVQERVAIARFPLAGGVLAAFTVGGYHTQRGCDARVSSRTSRVSCYRRILPSSRETATGKNWRISTSNSTFQLHGKLQARWRKRCQVGKGG